MNVVSLREQPAWGIQFLPHNCEGSSLTKELTSHNGSVTNVVWYECFLWSGRSQQTTGLLWMWSAKNVDSYERALKWTAQQRMWSVMNVACNEADCCECGLLQMWSVMNVFSYERDLWSVINVVCNERGLQWTLIYCECGLLWMWSLMNVICYERGLLWTW